MVKYACKVTSSRCLSQSFTAVHEDVPKCMPEEFLLLEPFKLDIRGFESRRALQNVSPVDWFCPSGRKKNGTRNRVRERFYSDIRYHSAKREVLRHISQSNANGALPENGYRVIPNSAKKSFRTLQEALKFSAAAFA